MNPRSPTRAPIIPCSTVASPSGKRSIVFSRKAREKRSFISTLWMKTSAWKGVIPTRRLLTTPRDKYLEDIMIRRVVKLPETATVYDACEYFVMYRFLAFPIVDAENHILGIIDVNVFTDEIINMESSREELNTMFEDHRFPHIRGSQRLSRAGVPVPVPLAAGHHRQRNHVRGHHRSVRGNPGPEPGHRLLPGHAPGPGGKASASSP